MKRYLSTAAVLALALMAGVPPLAAADAPTGTSAPVPAIADSPLAAVQPAEGTPAPQPALVLPELFGASGSLEPLPMVIYYCPELPPDCCRTGWSGHCVVCTQGGC